MILAHIKLKNSEDVIAFIVEEFNDCVKIKAPVKFDIDPVNGLFAKEWMMHCDINEVVLSKADIFFIHKASEDTIDFYTQFTNRNGKLTEEDVDSDYSDLENLYNALLESKGSTKH